MFKYKKRSKIIIIIIPGVAVVSVHVVFSRDCTVIIVCYEMEDVSHLILYLYHKSFFCVIFLLLLLLLLLLLFVVVVVVFVVVVYYCVPIKLKVKKIMNIEVHLWYASYVSSNQRDTIHWIENQWYSNLSASEITDNNANLNLFFLKSLILDKILCVSNS